MPLQPYVLKKKNDKTSSWHPSVGIFLGLIDAEEGFAESSEVGVNLGIKNSSFSFGIEFSNSVLKDFPINTNRNNLILSSTYSFDSDVLIVKNTYVGLGTGISLQSAKTTYHNSNYRNGLPDYR